MTKLEQIKSRMDEISAKDAPTTPEEATKRDVEMSRLWRAYQSIQSEERPLIDWEAI